MAMGRSGAVQDDLMATWAELPRSPGHAFYDRLQELLSEAGFDAFVEQMCASGETYREMLTRRTEESGIETPSAEDLARFDRNRKDKTLSNADWASAIDPDAGIARMKDGTTHLAYKPEHAVDLDTGGVVAAPIHPADGDVRNFVCEAGIVG